VTVYEPSPGIVDGSRCGVYVGCIGRGTGRPHHHTAKRFQVNQHRYNGDVDTVTYQGRTIRIKWEYDQFGGTPWDFSGSEFVSDWVGRDKRPGEVVICNDRGSKRFYDFADSVAQLKKDGISGTDADRIAKSEAERFRDWCNDQWYFMTASVSVDGLEYTDCLGAIESDCAAGVIDELLPEAKHAIDKHQRNLVAVMRLLLVGV